VVETAIPVLKTTPKYEIVLQRAVPTPYLDPQNALFTDRSFYFAINSAKIKPESAAQMELHGKFLAANPQINITIEGSSDSRGESDFNFALGKKRALAVAKALKAFGVADSQMEIISLGRDQPKVSGNVESAWSKNRRVDIVYPAK
jgi:peptidoglycan-associated lipoprotein